MTRFRRRADGYAQAKGQFMCAAVRCRLGGSKDAAARHKADCPRDDCDMVWFPSQIERNRAAELLLLRDAGEITGLRFHPSFPLVVNGHKIGRGVFVADSDYWLSGKRIVEEVKPKGWQQRDRAAVLRIDLFRALYPHIELRIFP